MCHLPPSRRHPTWALGPSLSPTCRATQDTPLATRCRRHSANRRCCPALVPLLLPPSKLAHPFTPISSYPCTRARCLTSLSECSRSSPSQSSLTRWGCRPLFTPRLLGSRYSNEQRLACCCGLAKMMLTSFCFFFQGFSHLQSEYQKSIGGSQSPGAPGPGPGPGVPQSHDWDSEYCNRECGNHCRSVETAEAGVYDS